VRVRQAVDETQILTQTADKATNYDELTNEQKKSLEMKNEYFSNDEKTNEEDNSKYKNNKQRRQIVCKTVYSF
jgi:GTPase Era involved in 16S rRNA processing